MSLIVNGVTVDKVIVNGTEIQQLVVNGVVVYKVNSSLPLPTEYFMGPITNTENVCDFGLLEYNSSSVQNVSNSIFERNNLATLVWNIDSINMFYNTNRQVWINNNPETLYNSSQYKIPINFFQTDKISNLFTTNYDIAMTQTDDGRLATDSNLCWGPMLNYILGQDDTLFGVPLENKDEVFKGFSNWDYSSDNNAIGVDFISSSTSDTVILSNKVQQIAQTSHTIFSNNTNNLVIWFIQSDNDLEKWDSFYQILTLELEQYCTSDEMCLMPPDLLRGQTEWEEYFYQLITGQIGNSFRVMIVPLTTSACAKKESWEWKTSASTFASNIINKTISEYDGAYNGKSFAHGIIALDDNNTNIKKRLFTILNNWGSDSSVMEGN